MIKTLRPVGAALAVALFAYPSPASAAYVINVVESGGNVAATGNGSLNLGAFAHIGQAYADSLMWPSVGAFAVGSPQYDLYEGNPEGPASFGTTGPLGANSFSGGFVGLNDSLSRIAVPINYVSGSNLGTSTGTWNGQTFASLGLTQGTYVWTWGSGDNADSFTLNIGSAVPEPGTWAMMMLGFGAIGGAMRVRRRRQKISVTYA